MRLGYGQFAEVRLRDAYKQSAHLLNPAARMKGPRVAALRGPGVLDQQEAPRAPPRQQARGQPAHRAARPHHRHGLARQIAAPLLQCSAERVHGHERGQGVAAGDGRPAPAQHQAGLEDDGFCESLDTFIENVANLSTTGIALPINPTVARVFTPHPIQDRTDDEMRTYAVAAFAQIASALVHDGE